MTCRRANTKNCPAAGHARRRAGSKTSPLSARSTARQLTTWTLRSGLTVGDGINWQNNSTASLMTTWQLFRQLTAQLNVENLRDKKYININTYA